ncbi:MAG TPA: universal stress protein [Spirochaetia bacterium]|nr:universal stress protein [Spirochaetia bacterium]
MYGKILVPLDGSERAEKILPYVEDIARQFKSEVLLLLVIEAVPEPLGPGRASLPAQPDEHDPVLRSSRAYLMGIHDSLSRIGVASSIHVLSGNVVASIVELASREEVYMVAMASHGRSGLARVYYGSVADGVLHQIDRPLLLVRSVSPPREGAG